MKRQEYHQYIQEQKTIYQKHYLSFVEIYVQHFFSPNDITYPSYNPQGHENTIHGLLSSSNLICQNLLLQSNYIYIYIYFYIIE